VKIGIYLRSVASSRGAEQVAAAIARGLAARGHPVDLIVEDSGGWLLEELAAHVPPVGVVVLGTFASGRLGHRMAQARAVASAFLRPSGWRRAGTAWVAPFLRVIRRDDPPLAALARYVSQARPDVLLSLLNYPNLVLALLAPLVGDRVRRVVSVHNHLSTAAARSESRWVRSVPALMRRFLRDVDAIVATSHGVAADLEALAGPAAGAVRVIHNPGYRPEADQLAAEPSGHPWLDAPGPPVVLGVGKLKPQKDFATLLRAFARLRRARSARLVILGEGSEREALLALAKELGIGDDVDLPGFVRNPYPFYARSAVFALSSAWEGFGNVVVEALACGCSVVSTDCPSGPAEILDGGRFGRLVPVGDDAALAAALVSTLDAPQAPETSRARARDFSLDAAIAAWEALLAGSDETSRPEGRRRA
jgi:glycosyltransferase involved in cell wall biosynthesis